MGWVRFGSLRRLTPIDPSHGFGRGQPIDRYYIEKFLATNEDDIRGRVLEIGDSSYTRRFGGARVVKSGVLHVLGGNSAVTIVGDLTRAEHIPSEIFDCIILTQTLHMIYDVHTAVRSLHRILKPGGVLLATVPGIAQIDREGMDRWGDCWRFTILSAQRLLEEVFPASSMTVKVYGNVLAAIAFLHGLAVRELRQEELDYHDPNYEVLITIRAVKPQAT